MHRTVSPSTVSPSTLSPSTLSPPVARRARRSGAAPAADVRPTETIELVPRRLILQSDLSPGDILMLTAAVRDLHLAHPNKFVTDVRTPAPQLWENNPYLTPLADDDGAEVIDAHYPLVHKSNTAPYHFIHGYAQFLETSLGVPVPPTRFRGDIHLSDVEKNWLSQVEELGFHGRFWILMAGGKYDFTAKWWNPAWYQQVVDHFRGRIQFVQCGEAHHWHPPLDGVINLVGKTDIRQFVRLMYHADGVVCPVTFAMHLAAAVETKPGRPRNRACVVIAGGREPAQWEAYPHHQFISTNGALMCCDEGGCWKSRCQPVGDGDKKDQELCLYPIALDSRLLIPRCMHMISPADVVRRIEMYFEGGALAYDTPADETSSAVEAAPPSTADDGATHDCATDDGATGDGATGEPAAPAATGDHPPREPRRRRRRPAKRK